MSYYSGKKALIVGGSKGIGLALATQLAGQGATVCVAARGEVALAEAVEALGGAPHCFVVMDVSDREAVDAAGARAIEQLGGLDVLVCNTGYAECVEVLNADAGHFRRLMDTNFFGHVNVVQALAPHLTAQGHGDVVLVSSMLAVLSVYGYAGYSASKFAIRGFAEALRQELMFSGVRVKLYLPPTTDTPGLARENEDKPPVLLEMESASSFNATHAAADVARSIAKWIPSSTFVGYAGWDSWFQYFAARHFPQTTLRIADMELRGAKDRLKKKGSTPV